MTGIRRVECRKCGGVSESYARPGRCVDDRCNGEMVEVEYVPASELAGAVEAFKEVTAYFERSDLDMETSAQLMYAEAVDALARLLGGQ